MVSPSAGGQNLEFFHLKFGETPQQPTGSKVLCDGCEEILQSGCVFFYCDCTRQGTDLCIVCSLSNTPVIARHGSLKPCRLDARDLRRTYVDGPNPQEFRMIIEKARQNTEWKPPRNWFKFFHGIEVKGLDASRFVSPERYESPKSLHAASAVERRIPNDYSIYQDLDKDKKEIRLVGIAPGPPDAPLCTVLRTMQHPWDKLPWSALSYCWGPLDETRAIPLVYSYSPDDMKVNLFRCTANVERALRTIRDEQEPIWVWIDALCINQGNLDERAYQIGLMSEIYNRALGVSIWLDTTQEEMLAVSLIKKMMTFNDDSGDLFSRIVDCPDLKINGKDADVGQLVEIMGSIFDNPWFSRAWVLQEVWAARRAMVLCSHKIALPWTALVRAGKLPSRALGTLRWFPDGDSKSLSEPWTLLEKADSGQAGPQIPIFKLFLAVCQHFEVTDPRDKLYSILGIARETHNIADLPRLLAPNYNKPVWQVFSDFTRWHIQQTQSLEGLEYAADMRVNGGNNEVVSLPSWSLSPTYGRRGGGVTKRCGQSGEPIFYADNGIEIDTALVLDSEGSRDLILRGYQLEPVGWVDPCYIQGSNIIRKDCRKDCGNAWPCRLGPDRSHAEGGLEFFWKTFKAANSPDDGGECDIGGHHEIRRCLCCHRLDAILDVLTSGSFICYECMEREGEETVHPSRALTEPELYAGFAAAWAEQTGDVDLTRFCNNLRGRLLASEEKKKNLELFQIAMTNSNWKSVFTTKSLRLGLCPPETRAGDQIVALFGGRKPFILREEQDEKTGCTYWRLIGECYVPRVMGGKPVSQRLERGDAPETFVLK